MKKFLLALVVLALGTAAHAVAIGAHGGQKSMSRTLDANGQPVAFTADKPWNVFEVAYTATVTQVVDNKGNAPRVGILGKVCLESGLTTVNTQIYDASSTVATGLTGFRMAPPLVAVTQVMSCTDINGQFTSGLVIQNSGSTGSTYVYWK